MLLDTLVDFAQVLFKKLKSTCHESYENLKMQDCLVKLSIAMKLGRNLSSSAAEMPVKFQNNRQNSKTQSCIFCVIFLIELFIFL